jgi:hypothetical protein
MSRFKISPKAESTTPGPVSGEPSGVEDFINKAALVNAVTQGRGVKPMRLNLELDVDVHRRLKIRAAERGVSISKLVRDLIDKELSN